MEWYIILLLFLLLVLVIGLIILIFFTFFGPCTISFQQRTTNPELTRMQQEQEEKEKKKFSNRVKRTFHSSEKCEQPLVPVEDVRTVELTFKLGNDRRNSEEVIVVNESSNTLSDKADISQAEWKARQKRREVREKLRADMRRKYSC